MGDFNIALPTRAEHVQVVKPPLEDFRAKALISFVAPREEVMNQTCANVKYKGYERRPLIGASYEKGILEYAGITIDRNDYGSCDQYIGGRGILVLIPNAEGGITYVIVYHVPYR